MSRISPQGSVFRTLEIVVLFSVAAPLAAREVRLGLNAALDQLEADPAVDVVVTLGFVASHVAARRVKLPKPTIAALVLQTFPAQGGVSGRHNFTFVASFDSVGDEVGTFHRVIGFSRMAVLADRLSLQGVPELEAKAAELRARIGIGDSSTNERRLTAEIAVPSERAARLMPSDWAT